MNRADHIPFTPHPESASTRRVAVFAYDGVELLDVTPTEYRERFGVAARTQ